jgi:hypothetical protein
MAEQADTPLRSSPEDRYGELESRLQEALNKNATLEVELADAVVHAGELECELAVEQELRQSLEEAVQDNNFVSTLERMVARHTTALQDERAHLEEVRARMEDRLEAATIRHKEAILDSLLVITARCLSVWTRFWTKIRSSLRALQGSWRKFGGPRENKTTVP